MDKDAVNYLRYGQRRETGLITLMMILLFTFFSSGLFLLTGFIIYMLMCIFFILFSLGPIQALNKYENKMEEICQRNK